MTDEPPAPKRSIQLPRFLVQEPVGLGDVIKRVTASVGVAACGACQQRAERLNQWVRFTPSTNQEQP